MKLFNLNKTSIANLETAATILGGADTGNKVPTDNPKECKTVACFSINALICTNPTISGEPVTNPVDTEPA
ncbi:hypothetical protein [Kordia sp.]|uniref:hypothetical protein n=1 Tax=Kordia sp. TaxID=1965332 RepID=UPI003D6BB8AD